MRFDEVERQHGRKSTEFNEFRYKLHEELSVQSSFIVDVDGTRCDLLKSVLTQFGLARQ